MTKKSKPSAIYCSAETKYRSLNLVNDENNQQTHIITSNFLPFKEIANIEPPITKSIKYEKSNTTILNQNKIFTYLNSQRTLTHQLKTSVHKVKKSKKNDDSDLLFYTKTILLFLLFWGILIVLYSHNIALQLASLIIILKILGYIALAVIIWLIVYLIVEQLKN